MVTTGALQIFDGVMLSDGGLIPNGKNAQFKIGQEGVSHMDWLLHIEEALAILDIEMCSGHPRIATRKGQRGRTRTLSWMASRTSPFLSFQHMRWYANGYKEVPSGFTLTPISLANWFMGDGTSAVKYDHTIVVQFATHSFSFDSIAALDEGLHGLNIETGRWSKKKHIATGSGVVLSIRQDSVDRLMGLIEPHIVPSFAYKVKYRRGAW